MMIYYNFMQTIPTQTFKQLKRPNIFVDTRVPPAISPNLQGKTIDTLEETPSDINDKKREDSVEDLQTNLGINKLTQPSSEIII
jgi:hypothetical protein